MGRTAIVSLRQSFTGCRPKPEVIGPGAKMLEEMRKKGRPVTPWMEKMAANMDKMQKEGADLGEVSLSALVCPPTRVLTFQGVLCLQSS